VTNSFLRILQVAGSLLLVATGCTQLKEPPVISSVDGSRSVKSRDSADYTCNASDPDWKLLTYSWSSVGGSLGWNWGRSVRWFAPESSGEALVRVTVSDEDGLTATDSFTVAVRAETLGVLFWDGAVKAGDFRAWPDTVRTGYKLYGRCGSDAGDIFLMVMDDTNFTKWVAGQPAVPLLQRLPYQKDTFSVRIPAFGQYYLIMDNTQGAEDYNYYLNVWKAGP
jgi:hypothetical protein